MRGPQSALSPGLGAPATPAAWHIAHTLVNVALPAAFSAGAAAGAGAVAAGVAGAEGAEASCLPQAASSAAATASVSVSLFMGCASKESQSRILWRVHGQFCCPDT